MRRKGQSITFTYWDVQTIEMSRSRALVDSYLGLEIWIILKCHWYILTLQYNHVGQ
jgi:hypothetical protein